MRFDKIVSLAVLAVLLLTAGCGYNIKSVPASVAYPEQERQFAGALQHLQAGNEQKARDLLVLVCEAPPLSGVTDEALFRLALLDLRDDSGKGVTRSQELLDRLKDEYPNSLWTRQAAPLASYLAGVKTLRDRQRELKSLRELNLSLSRDNRELRQTIERLKNLDMELEQKIKR